MFGFSRTRLPVTAEQQQWVDGSFVRLASIIGADRLFAPTVLPTAEFFPDPYNPNSPESLSLMASRVARSMEIDPTQIELTLFQTHHDVTRTLVPFGNWNSSGAGGLYFHDPDRRTRISINQTQMKNPMALVGTLAHEFGHVILLRPGLVKRDEPDMEPLNDLLTVFLGFGIFSANSAFQFEQYTTNESQGWSTQRLGYLSEEVWGYALARYALERDELKPAWRKHLVTNIATYMERSLAWLRSQSAPKLLGSAGPLRATLQ